MGRYSKINHDKLIELLEEFGFPYNDTLTEIFYRFSNNEPNLYDFYYRNDAGELTEDAIYRVLSFSKHSDDYIRDALENIVASNEGEFYPFAVDENGDYIGYYVGDFGEEEVRLYICDLDTMFTIVGENNEILTLEDFLNGMR